MSLMLETQTRQVTLPRVNLLPPEIAQQRRFRRTQGILAAALLSTVGVVAGIYVLAAGEVERAEEQLAVEQARSTELQSEASEYADVPRTYAQVDVKEAQVEAAMGQEVRWSYYLNYLQTNVPEKVWMTEMIMTQNVDAAAAPALVPDDAFDTPGVGDITFTGNAFAHNDVAVWLEALAAQKGYAQPSFTTSELQEIGTKEVVEYTSTVVVTADALSGRYAKGNTP